MKPKNQPNNYELATAVTMLLEATMSRDYASSETAQKEANVQMIAARNYARNTLRAVSAQASPGRLNPEQARWFAADIAAYIAANYLTAEGNKLREKDRAELADYLRDQLESEAPGGRFQIMIVVDGGRVDHVMTNAPADYHVLEYDEDGDPAEQLEIPQAPAEGEPKGKPRTFALGFLNPVPKESQVAPDRITEILTDSVAPKFDEQGNHLPHEEHTT